MGKKPKGYIKINSEASLALLQRFRKVRWEFLRLNKNYQDDYDKFKAGKIIKPSKKQGFKQGYVYKAVKQFSEKWLVLPYDYRDDTPPFSTNSYYEPIFSCASNNPNVMVKCLMPLKGVSVKGSMLTAMLTTLIGIQINPLFPRDFILGIIKGLLDDIEEVETTTIKTSGYLAVEKKMRLPDYETILKAYKLRHENPKELTPFPEIAKEMFGIKEESHIQKVRRWCEKAELFIQQGIKAFPPSHIDLTDLSRKPHPSKKL